MGLEGIISKLSQAEKIIDRITPKVSLDTFMESVSDTIDQLILQEREKGLCFLGGKTYFSLSEDLYKVEIRAELFLIKPTGGVVKKETRGTYPVSMLNQRAYEELVAILQSEGGYIAEIKEP